MGGAGLPPSPPALAGRMLQLREDSEKEDDCEGRVTVKPQVDDEGGAEGIEVDRVVLKRMPLCVEVVAEEWMKLQRNHVSMTGDATMTLAAKPA